MKNLFLILFFIALFIGVIFTALSNMGGNNDTMVGIAEQYVESALGGNATVGQLNNMQYFPTALVDVEDIVMTRGDSPEPAFTLGAAQISMSFWDVTFSSGKLKVLNIKDLYAMPGVITQKELYLKRFGIMDEKVDEAPYILAQGKYGGREFQGHADMERTGKATRPKYKLGEETPFSITSGNLSIEGKFIRQSGRKMIIDNIALKHGQNIVNGTLTLQSSANQESIYIEGQLTTGSQDRQISPDLHINLKPENAGPAKVSGTIKAQNLNATDIKAFLALIQELQSILTVTKPIKGDQTNWGGLQMDIDLHITGFIPKTGAKQDIETKLTIDRKILNMGALEGKI